MQCTIIIIIKVNLYIATNSNGDKIVKKKQTALENFKTVIVNKLNTECYNDITVILKMNNQSKKIKCWKKELVGF